MRISRLVLRRIDLAMMYEHGWHCGDWRWLMSANDVLPVR